MSLVCRGVRGATTASSNDRDEILTATRQLLALMIRLNDIDPKDVTSAIFSTTRDLDCEFPALAARQLGWLDVPLMCTNEIHAVVQDNLYQLDLPKKTLLFWEKSTLEKMATFVWLLLFQLIPMNFSPKLQLLDFLPLYQLK